jgi:hypothetical protein
LVYGPKPGCVAQKHTFRTAATVVSQSFAFDVLSLYLTTSQASIENKLLKDIYSSVKSHYHNDVPLHHLPSASDPDWDPAADNSTRSSIFVVQYEDFVVMSPHKLQEIFRRRHILVCDTPSAVEEFSAANLAALGGFERLRNIQGTVIAVSTVLLLTKYHRYLCSYNRRSG